jgi:hypothetical protein
MMGSPTDSQGGGGMGQQQGIPLPGGMSAPWWIESWKSYIAAALAVLEALCGVITAISIFPSCIIAGILQVLAAVVVLAVEAPTFVGFLSFAAPIGMLFDGRPNWMKAAAYTGVAVIPMLPGCFGLFIIFGFLSAICIAAIYGILVLGRKASRDEMRFQAAGSPPGDQYATSP